MSVRYGWISMSKGNEISVADILGTVHSPMPKKELHSRDWVTRHRK